MALNNSQFDFSAFRKVCDPHSQSISDTFLQWFVGFFEGDGWLTVNHRKDLIFGIPRTNRDVQIL